MLTFLRHSAYIRADLFLALRTVESWNFSHDTSNDGVEGVVSR